MIGGLWTYVHSVVVRVRVVLVQTGYNCVDRLLILLVHLRAGKNLDPFCLHHEVHVNSPLHGHSPGVALRPLSVDHHIDPLSHHRNESSVIGSKVPYDRIPFLANEFALKLAMLDHHHDHLPHIHGERY